MAYGNLCRVPSKAEYYILTLFCRLLRPEPGGVEPLLPTPHQLLTTEDSRHDRGGWFRQSVPWLLRVQGGRHQRGQNAHRGVPGSHLGQGPTGSQALMGPQAQKCHLTHRGLP